MIQINLLPPEYRPRQGTPVARFAAIVVGLLTGAPIFGIILQLSDSYNAAWTTFALLSALVAVVVAANAAAIHRECS